MNTIMYESDFLSHHGVLGQKHGVRRYQYKDGSLTPEGRAHYGYGNSNGKTGLGFIGKRKSENTKSGKSTKISSSKPKEKSISEMTDAEIQAKINRLRLEQQLNQLSPQHISRGRKIVNAITSSAATIAKDKGTKIAGDLIDKKLREMLKLNNTRQPTASERLRQQADDAQNRYRQALAEDNLDRLRRRQQQNP